MLKKFTTKYDYLVGVISDTHGRLPPTVLAAFRDVDLIIHAGDVGKAEILESLDKVAPTIAVRGNMDMGGWAGSLAGQEVIKISKATLCVLHDVGRLELSPDYSTYDAVISGHTHRPTVIKQNGILYLNPGSAVQPRYGYPPSVALLRIQGNSIEARLIELKDC
jgi:putative phosphoesterase